MALASTKCIRFRFFSLWRQTSYKGKAVSPLSPDLKTKKMYRSKYPESHALHAMILNQAHSMANESPEHLKMNPPDLESLKEDGPMAELEDKLPNLEITATTTAEVAKNPLLTQVSIVSEASQGSVSSEPETPDSIMENFRFKPKMVSALSKSYKNSKGGSSGSSTDTIEDAEQSELLKIYG